MPKRKLTEATSDAKAKCKKTAVRAARTNSRTGKKDYLAENNITNSSTQTCKPLLVVLPGSSGHLSKGMSTVLLPALEEHFRVCVREGKWKGWSPVGEHNVQSVLDLSPTQGEVDWYIMGNSFGNRVLCAMFVENLFPVPPKSMIVCGYPMYGPNNTDERVDLLQQLDMPAGKKLLCISGEKDEFLLRGGRGNAQAVLSTVLGGVAAAAGRGAVEAKVLKGGKHGVLDHTSPLALQEAADTVLGWILCFLELGPPMSPIS